MNDSINIAIAASDRATAVLDGIEKQFVRTLGRMSSMAGPQLLQEIPRAMGVAKAAITALDVAFSAANGNITDAAEALKKMPFGIGETARAAESLLGHLTGITSEIEKQKKMAEDMNAAYDAQLKAISTVKAYMADTAKVRQDEIARTVLSRLTGADKEKAQAEISARQRIDQERARAKTVLEELDRNLVLMQSKVRSLSAAGRTTGELTVITKAMEDIEKKKQAIQKSLQQTEYSILTTRNFEIAEIDRRAGEERIKQAKKTAEELEKVARAEAKAAAEAARDRAERIRVIEADTVATRLRIQGKEKEAELHLLDQDFKKRVQDAYAAGDKQLGRALVDQWVAKMDEINLKYATRATTRKTLEEPPGINPLESQFLRYLPGSRGGIDEVADQAKQQNRHLENIERNIEAMNRRAEAGGQVQVVGLDVEAA